MSEQFVTKLAETPEELRAAQRLRYDVFVQEMGATGPMVDHAQQLEQDHFDPYFDHLLLIDRQRDQVAGVYRLLRSDQAKAAGGFYSAGEFDLRRLVESNKNLLELGRSCLRPAYRGGAGMMYLWSSLAQYVHAHQIDVLFGVASFPGTDVEAIAEPLSLLHHNHLAPHHLCVRAHDKSYQTMNLIDKSHLDRRTAMIAVPSLIKAYLRLGGCVGDGAFVDHDFNTTDVCLIMDTNDMNAKRARLYGAGL